jgi:circadian clock protein KaiB
MYELRLYVVENTPRSNEALANLKRMCEAHFPGQYHIDVVDLAKNPQLARDEQILAIPTVVRNQPQPTRKMIGDLSNTDRVLVGLDLVPSTNE